MTPVKNYLKTWLAELKVIKIKIQAGIKFSVILIVLLFRIYIESMKKLIEEQGFNLSEAYLQKETPFMKVQASIKKIIFSSA